MLDANCTNTFISSTCITLTFLMTLLAFAIILGNAVVILAFVVDKTLRHRSNYFFLNLAISDFFVGMISIPLYIPYALFKWSLRDGLCTFWLIIDYLLCTTSVYNIVLITYDRYQSISDAVSYRAKQTNLLKIVALMLAVWVLAFLVHGPMILISHPWKEGGGECEPGFFSVWYIIAITSFFEFLVPVISVAYFNIYIYWSIWKRGHLSRCPNQPCRNSSVSSSTCGHTSKSQLRPSLPDLKETITPIRSGKQRKKSSLLLSLRTQINRNMTVSKMWSLSRTDSVTLHQREHLELLRIKKLAKSLAILLGVFAICWAPYSVSTIFVANQHPKPFWYEVAFWLQWLNSLINPFLYPLCHKHFQKAFMKIFCVKRKAILSRI
ncbi:histamine H4 receptor [Echinops telfairi]|uniref:Histamine H4 receptor n=1 Tax=Echinops telfairi TaxID=9371 RepID=A0ABM0IM06_ECHTE|nr:histamine H4 receptor [Echinops telfairi]